MLTAKFLLRFRPETWTFTRKFLTFAGPPFKSDGELITGTAAVVAHCEKYEIFAEIANDLVAKLSEEAAEFDRVGYSTTGYGRALAAILEAMFSELYSALDGMRRTLFSAYRGVSGLQNKSTLTFFERAAKNAYGPAFPATINSSLADAYASWFSMLRTLRTETTHGETGSCYLNRSTKKIVYSHGSLTGGRRELKVDDVIDYVNETYKQVEQLGETIFAVLYDQLLPIERRYVCGVHLGRAYERMVAPSATLSFHDGRCWSRVWFESEEGYLCPLRDRCGAYHRPVSGAERDAYFGAVGRKS